MGTVNPTSGTFNQAGTASSLLNPYRNPKPWYDVILGTLTLPGVVVSIDGHEKIDEWAVQKGIEVSHAITVWRGTKLAEGIRILLNLPDESSFDGIYTVRDLLRPKIGKKPPALPIINAAINFSGITRVSRVNVGPPKPAAGLAWTSEITLIEYNPPKPAKVGPPDPPKVKSENDVLADQLAAAVAEARKL